MSMRVDKRDRLYVSAGFTDNTQSITCRARVLTDRGVIVPFQMDLLQSNSPSSGELFLPLVAGELLTFTLSHGPTANSGRDITCNAGLVRDETVDEIPLFTLLSGNVNRTRPLSWPAVINEGDSAGLSRWQSAVLFSVGPPSTVSSGVVGACQITAISFLFTTGSAVGTRQLRFSYAQTLNQHRSWFDFVFNFLPSTSYHVQALPGGAATTSINTPGEIWVTFGLPDPFVLQGQLEWSVFELGLGFTADIISVPMVEFLY